MISNITIKEEIIYPDSDGKQMADNTEQFDWIVTIKLGMEALFKDNPDVFIAGDLLWYPVEGNPKICTAPDILLAFGRPKGKRGSYKQWVENNIAPQVVFEILSPGNTPAEMTRKYSFYHRYGVEEYYLYDPDKNTLDGWIRTNNLLETIEEINGWLSPRLQTRFVLDNGTLYIYAPDGNPFPTYLELLSQKDFEQKRAEQEAQRAEQEAQRAEQEAQRAEQEAQRAEQEAQRAEQAEKVAKILAEKLKELGIEPTTLL